MTLEGRPPVKIKGEKETSFSGLPTYLTGLIPLSLKVGNHSRQGIFANGDVERDTEEAEEETEKRETEGFWIKFMMIRRVCLSTIRVGPRKHS